MKKVIIVGGGFSGLLSAFAMSKHRDVDVTILEHKDVGGHFLYGGYKYVRRSDSFASMLHDLGCVYSTYPVNGGILLKDEVIRYPADFYDLDKPYIAQIRTHYWEKTRKTCPGKHIPKAFADPFSYRTQRAIRPDFEDVIDRLKPRFNIMKAAFVSQADNICYTTSGPIEFDHMIFTIPLNAIKDRVDFYVPSALSTKLSIIEVLPLKDPYYRFDYIYTPYTPENHVHRISSNGHTYFAEVSGFVDETKIYSDLNWLFKGGWSYIGGKEKLRGHLMPMDAHPDWPENIRPVGRYAQWLPKLTMDQALDEAIQIGQEWFE